VTHHNNVAQIPNRENHSCAHWERMMMELSSILAEELLWTVEDEVDKIVDE